MRKIAKAIGMLTAAALLASCDDHVTVEVAGKSFCVPKANLSEDNIWWIPKSLPKGGFGFHFDADVGVGAPRLLSGIVEDSGGYREWESPSPSSFYGRVLDSEKTEFHPIEGTELLSAVNEMMPHSYLVVSKRGGIGSYDVTAVAAVCGRGSSAPKHRMGMCSRAIPVDGAFAYYHFEVSMLPNLPALDKAVTSAIRQWHCQPS